MPGLVWNEIDMKKRAALLQLFQRRLLSALKAYDYQASQNDSRFEISSDCVVIGSLQRLRVI